MKKHILKITSLTVALFIVGGKSAWAQSTEIDQLKAAMEQMQKTMQEMQKYIEAIS